MAQSHIHLGFTWQAWHNLTSTVVLRGRHGTHGTGWRAWARLVARDAAALCVAGVALGDIHLGSTWQAWHNLTSTLISRGRHGAISHPLSFCVAGVALMALGGAVGPAWSRVTPRHFAWQAWRLVTSTLVPRGRRGIHLGFTWQAWHNLTSTVALRGRCGAHGTGWRAWARLVRRDAAALCVAGVALGDIHLGFTWQAWRNLTSTVVLRGRCSTHVTGWRAWARLVARDAAALCVAGAVLGDIHLGFTWQAWHLETSTFVLRGRRGP